MSRPQHMPGPDECRVRWNDASFGSFPLAWHVRVAHPSRWLRLYALPGGKSPPETEGEFAEITRRFELLVLALGGNFHENVCLLSPVLQDAVSDGRYGPQKLLGAEFACVLQNCCPSGEDAESFDIYAAQAQLSEPKVWQILRFIQQDQIMQSIVLLENGNLIAPYDGGFDIFVKEPQELAAFGSRFSEWLSPRSDGL